MGEVAILCGVWIEEDFVDGLFSCFWLGESDR